MKYWTATLLGMAICTASLIAGAFGIYHLVRTGTCASGGPYVSARPCPPGTGGHIMALIGGIFGVLIGGGIYAARGRSKRPGRLGMGIMLWTLGFIMLAGGGLLGAYGPANGDRSDSKLGAIIVAAIFIPMALIPFLVALFGGRGSRGSGGDWNPSPPSPVQAHTFSTPRPSPTGARPAQPFVTFGMPTAPAGNGGDSLARLEQLAQLHSSGALTDAEFAAAKAKLLARG